MRLRLLHRRLTISAPRMTVRSTMPWVMRWVLAALVLGFSAGIGLWAFEKGKDLAGLDRHAKEELTQLRNEVRLLRNTNDKNQSIVNTSELLLATERAEKNQLVQQVKQLTQTNQSLNDDLGFFQKFTKKSNKLHNIHPITPP